ncbi:SprT-like family-domain-containing protein [Irpex lacteus]|nr:SprT-like family-domain-containing protein [Irpex lacteus]
MPKKEEVDEDEGPNTSEEERMRAKRKGKQPMVARKPMVTRKLSQVIEISSDEDEEDNAHLAAVEKFITTILATPRSRNIRYVHAHKPISISSSDSEDEHEDTKVKGEAGPDSLLNSPVKASHTREVIDLTLTSSDEAEEDEVLEELVNNIGSQSQESEVAVREALEPTPEPQGKGVARPSPERPPGVKGKETRREEDVPIPRTHESKPTPRPAGLSRHSTPSVLSSLTSLSSDASDAGDIVVSRVADTTPCPLDDPPPAAAAKRRALKLEASPSLTPSVSSPDPDESPKKASASTAAGKKPRMTKKFKQAIEQTRREKYAQDLFEELNRAVFKGGLPKETQLKWSNRLLTTAGRARWKKSRDGSQTSEIELATKILDCDERIRNTLSHEMCHLACWIIDGDPKEGHGKAFKSWAAKIMRRRSDIEVTTRHNYEINYPYEWECENCAKIYGRYSKSIRPDECRCGACKVGVLVPLFKVRAPRTPQKTKADSRLAAIRGRGKNEITLLSDCYMDCSMMHVYRFAAKCRAVTSSLTLMNVEERDENASPTKKGQSRLRFTGQSNLLCLGNTKIDLQLAALTEELGGVSILGD